MKRSFLRLAAPFAVAALALTACSGGTGADGEGDAAGGIVIGNGSEPQNPLVPTNTNETGGGKIIDLIFAGLVYYDAEGAVHNDLAESIETEDAQNYTIKIKEGETFSDGSPVTANSFVDAWNQGVAEAHLSSYFFEPIKGFPEGGEPGPDFTGLEGLKVVDDTTFTVELSQPEADFPLRLGYSAFYPLPEAGIGDADAVAAFGAAPIGNGPYLLESADDWKHNESILLKVNPDYDGPRKAQNGGIELKFYAQQDAAYNDLLGGNLDVLDAVPDSAFSTFETELGDRAVNQPSAIFQSFTIPDRLPHFAGEEGNLRRQALSMAINRQEITDTIFQGTRSPAHDYTSPVIDGYSENVPGSEVMNYDPEKAKELWAQADAISPWEGSFEIAYNADGGHQAWVDATTNSIKNTLGIDAKGAPYPDFKSLRDEVTNRTIQTAFRTGWQADYPGLGNFLAPLYATGAGSNDGDYSSAEFDGLLSQAAGAASVEESNDLYLQAQSVLFRDLPAIPLWYSNVTGGSIDTVDNVQFGWNSVPLYYQITK
ncbi:MAG: ABC transporter substrate-binding protein [Actinomycetaceae bacterium]|nr:ABC transporter substrate-binding protein [Actinomycetaceae bacterium]